MLSGVRPVATASENENSAVVTALQRLRLRQFVEQQGALTAPQLVDAMEGWKVTLDAVEAAARSGDMLYLQTAVATGVLDFPSLTPVLQRLSGSDPTLGGRPLVSKEEAQRWEQAALNLRKAVKTQTPSIVLTSLSEASAAYQPFAKAGHTLHAID